MAKKKACQFVFFSNSKLLTISRQLKMLMLPPATWKL